MIPFDKSKFKIEIVQLIAISSALGGSFRHVVDGEEVRRDLPFSVARKLVKRYGQRLLHPIQAFAVSYDGEYVAVDSHLVFDSNNEGPIADTNFIADLRNAINELSDNTWSYDGRFVYKLHNIPVDQQVKMTQDGMMRSCPATCIDLQGIRGNGKDDGEDEDAATDVVDDRDCVLVYSSTGKVYNSSPIWSSLSNVRRYAAENGVEYYQMDMLDRDHHLTLDFTINVAKVLGYHFGYKHVAPLRIPQLMVSLGVVNLATIDHQTRSRIDCGFTIKQAVLYLIGYLNSTTNLSVYIQIRQQLKHTIGRWMKSNSDHEDNMEIVDAFSFVQMKSHEELEMANRQFKIDYAKELIGDDEVVAE